MSARLDAAVAEWAAAMDRAITADVDALLADLFPEENR